jgi:exopolysaccharide production protein ExoZ
MVGQKTYSGAPVHTIECIQVLRFVAAALVVAFHCALKLAPYSPTPPIAHLGSIGVDLFFVISGFIMVYITHEKPIGFGKFMYRRIVRIVPIYWAFTFLVVPLLMVAPGAFASTAFTWSLFLKSLVFIPAPHPVLDLTRPLLIAGWTLNYEMFFYVVFGALLFLPWPKRVGIVAALLVALVAMRALIVGDRIVFLDFYGNPIVLEFVLGMFVAAVYLRRKLSPATLAVALAIAAALLWASLENGVLARHDYDDRRLIYWGLPAAGLVLVSVFVEKQYGWPRIALLRHLGDASYSIYLSHFFTIGVLSKAFDTLSLVPLIGYGATYVLFVIGSLVVGSASYAMLERPILSLLSRRETARAGIAARSSAVLRPDDGRLAGFFPPAGPVATSEPPGPQKG